MDNLNLPSISSFKIHKHTSIQDGGVGECGSPPHTITSNYN